MTFHIEIRDTAKSLIWKRLLLNGENRNYATRETAEQVFKLCGFDRHTDRARIVETA